ncbi:uncharacterized protein [Temnothorax nylanderi]|uniref:uncharacterized protein isoform X1 n=1 Tax=Temnothorax nylanderi TaxID=102681 RepID=UPI003A855F9C
MNVESLRKQRSGLKGKLTSIRNFIAKAEKDVENVLPGEITARFHAVEDIYSRFQAVAQNLLSLLPEEEYQQRDEVEESEFDERYYSAKAALQQLAERIKPPSTSSSANTANSSNDTGVMQVLEQQTILIQKLTERSVESSDGGALARIVEQQNQLLERLSVRSNTPARESHVKLPMITLPSFDGTMEEWKRYSDTFKTLIHDSDLTGVQKHQYLVGSLSGQAAKIIESIDISENNYAIAWDLLKKRYDDERGIRKRHIQCLFDLPLVRRESASAIQDLVDHVQKHLRVLQAMGLPTESWGDLIIYLIEKNLDNATRRRWEEHIEREDDVTTSTMIDFLQRQCQLLRRAASDGEIVNRDDLRARDGTSRQRSLDSKVQGRTTLSTTTQERRCYVCQGQHSIYACKQFLGLSVEDRIREARRLKLCLNCLGNNHFSRDCRSGSCRECGERHNTLCHIVKRTSCSSTDSARGSEDCSRGSSGITLCAVADGEIGASTNNNESAGNMSVQHARGERKQVLMSTAVVNVQSNNNENFLRVLLDSASEVNFITLAACNRLNIKLESVCESINGLNNMNCAIDYGCQISMKSRTSGFELSLCCLVVPKITKKLPSFSINISKLPIPENLKLADPLFCNPGHIDALIGGEFFLQLLEAGKIELGESLPVLQNTKFGWVVSGPIPQHLITRRTTSRQLSNNHVCLITQQISIDDTLRKFWELEEYANNNPRLSKEEQCCENHFINTTTRDVSGRFVVRLPFRENRTQLGQSRDIAMKRLLCLERKFQREPELYKLYSEFMREYIDLNHMSKVTGDARIPNPVYLPHHGVLRESSTTTKLRVVFNASSKTTSGISLNDALMTGPNLQDSIINIMLRFRLRAVAITADLQKMYRQVLVHEDDRDYQRILWRFSPNDSVEEYWLNTVTYGQTSASHLAISSVQQQAKDGATRFEMASRVLLEDSYVDDIITGADSEPEAIKLVSQLENLLREGGFETHKWRSNREGIVPELHAVDRVEESSVLEIDASAVKTLGLGWHPKSDMFQFSIEPITSSVKTKREVLSTISRLFDPLGLIGPILTRAKLIMQSTWLANLGWDEPLTEDLRQAWEAYTEDLREVSTIQVPRRVIRGSNVVRFILHAFCDASLKAYGACIYLQTIDADNNSNCFLLCSKARVAPVKCKTITLPRLELCGAVVLVNLVLSIRGALGITFDEEHAWTDSEIVRAWIAGDPSRQKLFVSNRIAEIQSILPSRHWHHVDGIENPADLISRGTSLKNLKQSKIWWEGPDWLSRFGEYEQRKLKSPRLTEEDKKLIRAEQASSTRVFANVSNSNDVREFLLNNYSSLSRIERILAWIVRFVFNVRMNRDNRKFGFLSIDEIRRARQLLIMAVQRVHFCEETSNLLSGRQIHSNSKLLSLHPFMDETGLLRVGGRIQNSQVSFGKKHPIILPSDSKFTRLLFDREHRRLLHVGPQALLYSIREIYWPLKGKIIARKITHDCITCFRNKPKPLLQIMGQLPADRVTPTRPFFVIGVDFAGPITTLVNRGRGRKTNKSYISLFICFSTRAVHLEAVSDLSTASFLAALRRFVGRRGCPQRIYSDNATNFVGSKNELHEMYRLLDREKQDVTEFCISHNIEWKFIPPSSPHMGGLWEAGMLM